MRKQEALVSADVPSGLGQHRRAGGDAPAPAGRYSVEELEIGARGSRYVSDPYRFYAHLRENAGVRLIIVEGLPVWVVTRFEDVRQALADPRLSNDPRRANELTRAVGWVLAGDSSAIAHHMLRTDPPDHTRLRKLVTQAFTSHQINALRPHAVQVASELMAAMLPRGRADLISDFAQPLPLAILTGLLGVPAEDKAMFSHWVATFLETQEGDSELVPVAMAKMRGYLSALIEERSRLKVGDAAAGCLLDALIAARDQGDRLNAEELLAMAFLMMVAGYETTTNLIGNGTLALLRNPDQFAALQADRRLLAPAIEEFLRYDGPLKMAPVLRFTTEAVLIGDVLVPGGGEPVFVSFGAANRDPRRFLDPDRLDIRRAEGGHLAFGHGIHHCLGKSLARMEAEVAFRSLLDGCRDLKLAVAPDELAWAHSRLMRGLKSLPVTFQAAPPASPRHS